MTYEFHGTDLETAEGTDAFKAVYDVVADSDSKYKLEENFDLRQWAIDSPEPAARFLRSLAMDESPRVRNFAGVLAIRDLMPVNPELAVDVASGVMLDEDERARGDIARFAEESLQSDVFDTWLEEIGLLPIQQLVLAVKRAKETYGDE